MGMSQEGITGLARGFELMLGTAIDADIWLQPMQKTLPPNAHVLGTFPGLLVSDLMSSSFPGWRVPVLKLLQTPLADSDEECGINHAIIQASTNGIRM